MSRLLPRRRLLSAATGALLLSVTGTACTGDPDADEAPERAELLRAATADLTAATALHWTGVFASATDRRPGVWDVNVRVAANGAGIGEVRNAEQAAEVLSVGGYTLLRANQGFWRWAGVLDDRLTGFPGRWVVLYDGFFGFDLGARLHPGALLGGAAPGAVVTAGESTDEGSRVLWNDVTYLVDPTGPRLVRIVTAGTERSPARFQLAAVPVDGERDGLFDDLRREASRLIDARDHGAQADFAGQIPAAFSETEVDAIVDGLERELTALR